MKAGDADIKVGPEGWTSSLEIRQLRAFAAIHAQGSVKGAAIVLGLAQSTVSEALSALERGVGVRVLRRRRGGHDVALTEAGTALLPHAHRILGELDAAHHAIATATHSAKSALDITANESVSTYLLPPVMHALRERWPNVRLSVTVATCADVRAAVNSGRSAIGLMLREQTRESTVNVHGASGPQTRQIVLLTGIPLVMFCGKMHSLHSRGSRTITGHDIESQPLFIADAAGDFHDLIRNYFDTDGSPMRRLEPVGSIDAVKRAVESDVTALGILPLYAVRDELSRSQFNALTLTPPLPHMQLLAMVGSDDAEQSPVVTELLARLGGA